MKRKSWFGLFVVAGLAMVFLSFLAVAMRMDSRGNKNLADLSGGDRIGVLPLTGVIMDSEEIIEQILEFRDDESIKAVVLRIDSPGGAVGPSQEIYEEIKKLDAKKPVITSVGSLCASGGYYAAVGSRRIFSNPGSLVGSIGVIIPLFDASELFAWAKIHPQFITSGTNKAIGHPALTMTQDQRAVLQSVVDSTYGQFVSAVAEGRRSAGMTTMSVVKVADGRILTGEQGMKAGLVDELGNLQDAIAYAGKLTNIKGEPKTAYPRKEKKDFLDYFFERTESSVGNIVRNSVSQVNAAAHPGLLYLWKP